MTPEEKRAKMTPSGLLPDSRPGMRDIGRVAPTTHLLEAQSTPMLKLDSPLIQSNGQPAIPWTQFMVSQWRLGQPTGVTPGTYGGITVNSNGRILATQASGAAFDSPRLTGNPTAPTPVANDNSTNIATTAWVREQGYLTSAGDVTQVITIGGDATGSGNENAVITVTVVGLHNRAVSGAAPNVGDALVWNGSQWAPAAQNFVPEAPIDGQRYVRQNGAWVVIVSP